VNGLYAKLDAIRQFRANLAQMRARGVDKATIADVESQGLEAGGKLAATLANVTDDQNDSIRYAQQAIASESERAGSESVAGLVRGLSKRNDELERAATRLARKLANAIRRELGIHSPSKVTNEVGRYVTTGLADGVLDNAREAELAARTVAGRVSSAIVPTLPDLARMANAASLTAVVRSSEVVTIRHEVVSPDGSLDNLTAQQIADVIARDPKAARVLERALRPARTRSTRNTISASDN
jgi:hypothetical protein